MIPQYLELTLELICGYFCLILYDNPVHTLSAFNLKRNPVVYALQAISSQTGTHKHMWQSSSYFQFNYILMLYIISKMVKGCM